MSRRAENLLFGTIGFFIGLISYSPLSKPAQLTFSPTFHFGHVMAAVTALLSAVLVTSFLQRQREADRSEKNLLMRQIEEASAALAELEKYREGGVLIEVTAALKKLSVKCSGVKASMDETKCDAKTKAAANFDEHVREIRRLATETPVAAIKQHATKSRCSSEVRNGIIKLASEQQVLLDTKINELRTAMIAAQLKINRM